MREKRRRRFAITSILLFSGAIVGGFQSRATAVSMLNGSTVVSAVCTQTPFPPQTRDFTVTLTVPRNLHRGDTFAVHLDIDFAVSSSASAGFAWISGGPAVTSANPAYGALQPIFVPPAASSISGDVSFVATGNVQSSAEWTVHDFGDGAILFGHASVYDCVPNSRDALALSRIVGGKPADK